MDLNAIPSLIPQSSKSLIGNTAEIQLSNLEILPDDGNPIPNDDMREDSLSIPDTEVELNHTELREYIARFNTMTRSLLPLLIACHSNESSLVGIGLEHLYHFITSSPIQLVNSKEDPIVDHLLSMVYDSILASFPGCCCNLENLLIKIADSFSLIPSSTMCILLSYLYAIQIQLFNMEDQNMQSSPLYYRISMNVQIFMSLMKSRVHLSDDDTLHSTFSLALQEKLTSFAYKLESPGMMDMDVLLIEMKTVSESVSSVDNQQNYVMYFLMLVSQIRRYGRVESQ